MDPLSPRKCVLCRARPASRPPRAKPDYVWCDRCWEAGVLAPRLVRSQVVLRLAHKNPFVAEYAVWREERAIGRLLFFRDEETLSVRLFAQAAEEDLRLIAEESIRELGSSWPHEVLDVVVMNGGARSAGEGP